MRKESLLVKIWNVLWPLFIYLAAQNAVSFLGGRVIENDDFAIVFVIVAAIICIPIYFQMHRKDQELAGEERKNIPMGNKDFVAIILCGAALALAANNLIALTPLPLMFHGYEETNEVLAGGGVLLQKTLMANSKKVYYLADHAKLNHSFVSITGDLSEISTVITDFEFPEETKKKYKTTEFIYVEK